MRDKYKRTQFTKNNGFETGSFYPKKIRRKEYSIFQEVLRRRY